METTRSITLKAEDVEDCTRRDSASDTSSCDSSEAEETRIILHGSPASPTGRSDSDDIPAPIDQLPVELLSHIILLHLQSLQNSLWHSWIPKRVKDLSEVSTWWREVILGTAAMWTYVQAAMPLDDVMLVLERSEDGPLDVECDKYRRDALGSLLHAVGPQIERWRSLRMDLSVVPSGLLLWLSQDTPGLEAIHIRSNDRLSRIDNLGEGRHFRSVEVSRVVLPWHSERFAGLHDLRIDNLDESGPTVRQVIAMLASSPQLKSLHLQQIEFAEDIEDEKLRPSDISAYSTPIDLPSLTHLLIKYISPDAYHAIVSRIRCPTAQSVILKARPDRGLLNHAAHPFIQRLLRRDKHVHLEVRERHAIIRTEEMWTHRPRGLHPRDGLLLRLRVPEGATQPGERPAWQHVAALVKVACPADVVTELHFSSSAAIRWGMSVLGHFPGLQRLTWNMHPSACLTELMRLLEFLARPSQGGWPCPLLKRIGLWGDWMSPESMLECVKGRWEEYKPELHGDGNQCKGLVEIILGGEPHCTWRPTV